MDKLGIDNLYDDMLFFLRLREGAVAQLGERLNGIQEADGSIPFSSTNFVLHKKGRAVASTGRGFDPHQLHQ